MDYGLFVLAEWVEEQKRFIDYGTWGESDRGRAEAFEEVIDKIKAMHKEAQRYALDD